MPHRRLASADRSRLRIIQTDMRASHTASLLTLGVLLAASARSDTVVRFNRDVRPILSEHCFACHGPDKATRMTSLRLDSEETLSAVASNRRKLVEPGKPEHSELYARISNTEPTRRMPPAAFGHDPLPARDVDTIRRWIEGGAEWQGHWAFVAPERPEVPRDRRPGWPINAIDSFILRRLNREGMVPSAGASRETLIRRLSLDLTGSPPELAEVDAFLADTSKHAYETLVDRLLSSPSYGERMAIRWLDAARYADTNGYQTDAERDMWRWRDWVIDAFSSNKPFDEFTVEQLAGDMLPQASLEQVIATGFNRNHRGNGEGGIVDAEYAVEYVADRVDTTSTIWLGLTLGCARCHDHKYDPISQKEYYELFAYFNNVPEKGKAFKYGNSPPFIKAPTAQQQQRLDGFDTRLAKLRVQHRQLVRAGAELQRHWEATLKGTPVDWVDPTDRVVEFPETHETPDSPAVTLRAGDFIDLGDEAGFGFYDRFSVTAWIRPEKPDGAIVSKTGHVSPQDDTQGNPGWGFYLKAGKLQVNLVNRWLDDCLRLESRTSVAIGKWQHVAFTYDGSRLASGVQVFLNGEAVELNVIRDEMNQEFKSKEPLRIGRGLGLDYEGQIRQLLIYGRALTAKQVEVAAVRRRLDQVAAIPARQRTGPEARKLAWAFINSHAPEDVRGLTARLRALEAKRQAYVDSIPTVMVMREMAPRRKTFQLDRGAYDAPTGEVQPGLPEALSRQDPSTRLGFANWLVSRDNPLTARVTVNRIWQMLWGTGLVKTVEDFGSQGEWPTHPDLLDWLAVEFVDSGWDMKAVVRTIVLSAAYQQSSRFRPELAEADPNNRLFARGTRLRLPAEAVRDISLAAAGLLVDQVGGPSVRPYQPAGLWTELAGGKDYTVGSGADLYRRSLYTFWKRAAPPPSMMIFDAAGREACTVRSTRTNTPLQALNRMNDESNMQASRSLAARALRESKAGTTSRLDHMFRLATSRRPSRAEREVLASGFGYHLDRFQGNPELANALLGQAELPAVEGVSRSEFAAYAMTASLVLNLDEAITRE